MMKKQELAEKIRLFEPNDGVWIHLDELLSEAFSSDDPQYFYTSILELFSRYPEDDGSEVFWSALHGMEHFGSYENLVRNQHLKSPSLMTKIMLTRIANTVES